MKIWKYKRLSECSNFVSERTSNIAIDNYISTENMIENRGGVKEAAALPDVKSTSAYKPNDILLSNIRPYFCKIWFADKKGSCSNDVLVVRAKKEVDPKFLYYVLSDQNFFNWDSMTSKGTKMPRGTPNAIMKYSVPDLPFHTQEKIASILSAYDNLIQNYKKQIEALQTAASELYKEWFVRFRFPGWQNAKFENGIPEGWKVEKIGEYCNIRIGGDIPEENSETKDEKHKYPIFSNGINEDGLYGFADTFKISEPSVTISARGTVGFVCLRREPYYPIVRLICLIPRKDLGVFYLYHSLEYADLDGNGTSQQQLTAPMVSKRKIVIAEENLIEKFNLNAKIIYNKIDLLKIQITNLTQQRDLLLPRLMSGKLEVK